MVNDDLRWNSSKELSLNSNLSPTTIRSTSDYYSKTGEKDGIDLTSAQIEVWKHVEPFNQYKDTKIMIDDLANPSKIERN